MWGTAHHMSEKHGNNSSQIYSLNWEESKKQLPLFTDRNTNRDSVKVKFNPTTLKMWLSNSPKCRVTGRVWILPQARSNLPLCSSGLKDVVRFCDRVWPTPESCSCRFKCGAKTTNVSNKTPSNSSYCMKIKQKCSLWSLHSSLVCVRR